MAQNAPSHPTINRFEKFTPRNFSHSDAFDAECRMSTHQNSLSQIEIYILIIHVLVTTFYSTTSRVQPLTHVSSAKRILVGTLNLKVLSRKKKQVNFENILEKSELL